MLTLRSLNHQFFAIAANPGQLTRANRINRGEAIEEISDDIEKPDDIANSNTLGKRKSASGGEVRDLFLFLLHFHAVLILIPFRKLAIKNGTLKHQMVLTAFFILTRYIICTLLN